MADGGREAHGSGHRFRSELSNRNVLLFGCGAFVSGRALSQKDLRPDRGLAAPYRPRQVGNVLTAFPAVLWFRCDIVAVSCVNRRCEPSGADVSIPRGAPLTRALRKLSEGSCP